MADISKITPPGSQTTYNLKDATAREQTAVLEEMNGAKNLAEINDGTYTGRYKEIPCAMKQGKDYLIKIGTLTSTDTSSSTCQIILKYIDNTTSVGSQISRGNNVSILWTNTLKDVVSIYLYPASTGETSEGKTVTWADLMVVDKDIYDAGFTDYQPYSLPNTKITPELIALVDSGAKNLLNLSKIKTLNPTGWTGNKLSLNGVDWTFNSDGSITVNGTANSSGSYPKFMSDKTLPIGTYMMSGGSSTAKFTAFRIGSDAGSGYQLDVTSSITQPIEFIGNVEANTQVNNVTIKPMICTKAAWDVSQKYVPYRPTYEETVEQVAENENNISLNENVTLTYTTNAYVDSTTFTRCACRKVSPHLLILTINIFIPEPSTQMKDFVEIGTLPYTLTTACYASQGKATMYISGNSIKVYLKDAAGGSTNHDLRQTIPIVIN